MPDLRSSSVRSRERRESRALATALRIPWRAVEEGSGGRDDDNDDDEVGEGRGENARVEGKFPRKRSERTTRDDDVMVLRSSLD